MELGLHSSMIKYLGSKRLLVRPIVDLIESLPGVRYIADLFSGTSRVGHALKEAGYHITANDHNAYAHILARCYVEADLDAIGRDAKELLNHLAAVPPREGYFTETFCERSRFFQPKNGARVDAIRDEITRLALSPELEAVALVALMEAADRVDSTCGVQMAYLKSWARRSYNDLELRMPQLLSGPGMAWKLDALDAAKAGKWDLVYLDPPYNQHKYRNNYHVWETLVRWDNPEVYGTACKRVDCREYSSDFNSRRHIGEALAELVHSVQSPNVLVSFNSEGYLGEDELMELLSAVGSVRRYSFDFKRYVGAQIGIFNPSGEKVGQVSHLRNQEHLYLVRR